MDLPTRLDLYQIARNYLATRTQRLDPAQVDYEGSDANIFAGIASMLGDAVIKQLGFRTAACTLGGSELEDVDRWAFDRYLLTRKGASPAVGPGRIFRVSFAAGAGSVPVGTRILTRTGVEYTTTSVASFGATDLSSEADFRAAQAGKATQVNAGQFARFADSSSLFDPSLQVENIEAMSGGEDAETDDLFKGRIRDFWRAARRGVLAAIEFGARLVPGVVSAQAIEALTEGATPARVATLYIADSSGVASRTLANLVRTSLQEFRAGGIAVLISTSLPTQIEIQLRLKFRAGVDTVTLTDVVKAAVVEFVNSLPVNSPLFRNQLGSVLQRYTSDGLIPDEGTVISPVGDLYPAVGYTLRTTMALITIVT